MSKLTKWLDGEPTFVGLYERLLPVGGSNIRYSWWNGTFWGGFAIIKDQAVGNVGFKSGFQSGFKYRGFTTKQS